MTYSVFKADVTGWRNHMVQAEFKMMDVPYLTPAFWSDQPIQEPLPLFMFHASRHAPKPDNFWTGGGFDLYAPKLLDLLTRAGVPYETFPAQVRDRKTGDLLRDDYRVFHLLARYPALDVAASWRESGAIYRLRLRPDVVVPVPMFRLDEQASLVLVHEEVKQLLEAHGVTGCRYIPIEAYQSGAHTILDQESID